MTVLLEKRGSLLDVKNSQKIMRGKTFDRLPKGHLETEVNLPGKGIDINAILENLY